MCLRSLPSNRVLLNYETNKISRHRIEFFPSLNLFLFFKVLELRPMDCWTKILSLLVMNFLINGPLVPEGSVFIYKTFEDEFR